MQVIKTWNYLRGYVIIKVEGLKRNGYLQWIRHKAPSADKIKNLKGIIRNLKDYFMS